MSDNNLMDMINDLLVEAPENKVHSKNRTADGKKKDPQTEKPSAKAAKDEISGSTKGNAVGANAEAGDTGDMNKGKISSDASDNSKEIGINAADKAPLNQNNGMDDKAPSGNKGEFASDASSNVEADKGPHNQGSDPFETPTKANPKGTVKEENEDEDGEDLEEKKLKMTKKQRQGALTKADNAAKNAAVSLAGPNGTRYKVKKNVQGKWVKEETGEELSEELAAIAEEKWSSNPGPGVDGSVSSGKEAEANKKQRPDVEKGNNAPKDKGGDPENPPSWGEAKDEDGDGLPDEKEPDIDGDGDHDEDDHKVKDTDKEKDVKEACGKKGVKEAEEDEVEGLDEDFKEKAQIIFETAVNEKVHTIREELEEDYKALLEQSLSEINEKVEEYLDYAVQEWISENQLEIKYSLRTEISENFIRGLRGLFEESYIDIPEEEVSVVDELTEELESYKEQLQIAEEAVVEANQTILEHSKMDIINQLSKDLTQTQAMRLEEMASHVEADDVEEFGYKVQKLKEANFLDVESPTYSSLTEEVIYDDGSDEVVAEGAMGVYTNFLSRSKR
ncbi:MAG: hypothetical protein N0C84_01190 [Candidatus Thiodiazotropha taylori]|uniref:Prohead core protein n=1 Tax=Candidatus Thiodiazotropha taylori TaxID=2792791 RepID=A0A9E4KAE0_9GAMM|nr:hypothetical protein [Candidatus Thiodiazotropha taylori]MCW4255061.1 hypothetical protein [Candidatus Thiodiazotropha taylori]